MTIKHACELVTTKGTRGRVTLHRLGIAGLSAIRLARQTLPLLLVLAICESAHVAMRAQASATPIATQSSALSQMSTAFSGGKLVQRVQLTGSATLQSGSLQDSGSATLTASADGSWQIQLALAESGQRTESRTAGARENECQWSGNDGVAHEATGSCFVTVVWFLPQITLQSALASPGLSTSDLGSQQTTDGVRRVIQNQLVGGVGKSKASVAASTLAQQQSTSSLALDSVTAVPLALRFNVLSDSGTQQIAIEIRYSNYKTLSGLLVPTHIERYLNGSLELTLDVTQASVLN